MLFLQLKQSTVMHIELEGMCDTLAQGEDYREFQTPLLYTGAYDQRGKRKINVGGKHVIWNQLFLKEKLIG